MIENDYKNCMVAAGSEYMLSFVLQGYFQYICDIYFKFDFI
jgi:hypothetical protein